MPLFRKHAAPPKGGLILFVHIPKTGGTSLRLELERQYSRSLIARDYAAGAEATSPVVNDYLYSGQSRGGKAAAKAALVDHLRSGPTIALTGHFKLSKYSRFFPPEQVISIARDPLMRAASEYLHKRRHAGYQGSFEEFYLKPVRVNRLSQALDKIHDSMIIGTTERYEFTLKLINQRFGISLRATKQNVAPRRGALSFVESLSRESIAQFMELNSVDYELYREIERKLITDSRR